MYVIFVAGVYFQEQSVQKLEEKKAHRHKHLALVRMAIRPINRQKHFRCSPPSPENKYFLPFNRLVVPGLTTCSKVYVLKLYVPFLT